MIRNGLCESETAILPPLFLEEKMGRDVEEKIDWDEIWKRGIEESTFRLSAEDVDARARIWDKAMRGNIDSGYVDELLGSMNLSSDLTALDVGCGSGFVAIPMAKRVRWVTALDQAPNMLDLTREYAAADAVHNLSTINKDWLQVEIGRDIEFHDIVLASRCLQTTELRRFLLQMDKAARKRCFIAWGAGYRDDDAEICNALNIVYKPPPSYMVVFNLLYKMGILANIEIHSRPITRWYRDLDEAVFSLLRGRPMEKPAIETLKAYYQERLTFRDGRYWRVIREPWALISWLKGN